MVDFEQYRRLLAQKSASNSVAQSALNLIETDCYQLEVHNPYELSIPLGGK